MAKTVVIDFSKVKDGGQFTRSHVPAGDYLAVVKKVEDVLSKQDKDPMWLFTISLKDRPTATYPYYCKHTVEQAWKIRNLLQAAGLNVPKKKLKVDPSKVVGKTIAVSLEDDEYDDKLRSEIAAIFPPSELDEVEEEEEEETEVEEEEEEETEAPDSDDEEEEEDEEEPPPAKKSKGKKKKSKASSSDDEDEEEEDEDLEEIEIEDI